MSSALAGRDGTSRSSKRAAGVPTRRRLMPSSQVSAIGFAPTRFASPPPGPLPTPGCMMNSPAPLSHRERQGSSPSELSSAATLSYGVGRAASPNPISPPSGRSCWMPTPCSFPTRIFRGSNPRGFANRGQRYVLALVGGADWRRCRNKGEWWCRTGRTTSSSGATTSELSFGPTQTRDVNARDRRSGTLWEGRYASSPIETEAYWLACGRYVELNPVRARMVKRPEPYRWSSSRARAGLSAWTWPDRDPLSRFFPHAFTSLAHMTNQADFGTA
jgi:hypothetical protein